MESPDPPLSSEVLLEHAAWVRRLAGELVRDPGAAEDVAQETWLAFLRLRPSTERPLKPWLARVVRNRAALWARSVAGRRAREAQVARPERVPSSDELVGRAEVQRRLVEAVLGLAEPYRSTVLLRYYEGFGPAEIAVLRRIPAATVRTHLHRGLERLRERLDREHGGERGTWVGMLVPLLQPSAPGAAAGLGGAALFGAIGLALVLVGWLGLRAQRSGAPPAEPAERSAQAAEEHFVDPLAPAHDPQAQARRVALTGASQSGSAARLWRLVDRGGHPLAGFAVHSAGEERISDAQGLVELPAHARELAPVDDARLKVDRPSAHGVRVAQALERAPIPLEPSVAATGDEPAQLELPAGPLFLLDLESPLRVDGLEFEALLVGAGLAEFRDEGLPRQLAPLRAPGYGFDRFWVRFGAEPEGAQDPRAGWRLELRDSAGLLYGEGLPGDVRGTQARELRVVLAPSGVIRGQIDAGSLGVPEDLVLYLQAPGGDAPPLRWTRPQGSGAYELRWLPPGEYELIARSKRLEPWSQRVVVRGGEQERVDLDLASKPSAGDLAGKVESESGEHAGQVLVLLRDDAGDVLDIYPATWEIVAGRRTARFRFREVPEGKVNLELISLAGVLAFRVEPELLEAPLETVHATLLDGDPRADWGFDVLDARSGERLAKFEVEVHVEDGPRLRFLGEAEAEAEVEPGSEAETLAAPALYQWTLFAGGMRWNRFVGPAPIRALGLDAKLRFTVRAEGFEPGQGSAQAFMGLRPGLRVARVLLTPR